MSRHRIELAGTVFETKKAAEDAIRAELDGIPIDIVFVSPMLSDLISKHHWYCSVRGLRPERFTKSSVRAGDSPVDAYYFRGWFPSIGWHGVSWRQCIHKHSWRDGARKLLRDLVADEMETFRLNNYQCLRCGKTRPPLHAHHLDPSFSDIFRIVWPLFTAEDERLWNNRDWIREENFSLPLENIAVSEFLRLHAGAQKAVLCVGCHQKEHRQRVTDESQS